MITFERSTIYPLLITPVVKRTTGYYVAILTKKLNVCITNTPRSLIVEALSSI